MTEQELKEAIARVCEADYEKAMSVPKHHFSRTFRRTMKSLLQPGVGKRTIPELYPVHGRRRAIVVVAVLVLLLGTTVMARGFFQSVLGKHVLTGYTDHVQLNLPESEDVDELLTENATEEESETEIDFEFVCKKPQWVPDGFMVEREKYEEDIGEYAQGYMENSGKSIWYYQRRSDITGNIGISSNGDEQQEVMIMDTKGYFIPDNVLDEEKGNLVWEDGKYLYMIMGDLTKEELIKMAETVK